MHQFQKHYTREEARALLPQIRKWLAQLEELQLKLAGNDRRLDSLMAAGGDLGGDIVNKSVKLSSDLREILNKFKQREIIIKDLERGLVDFPAIIGGREVFLCWEKDEEDVEYWHDIDAGYAGREPL